MDYPVTCPSCGASGHLPAAPNGRPVGCPQCHKVFVPPDVPAPPASAIGALGLGVSGGVWVDSPGVLDITGAALAHQPQFPPELSGGLAVAPPRAPVVPPSQSVSIISHPEPAPAPSPPKGDASRWAREEIARAEQGAAAELEKLRRARLTLAEVESRAEATIHARTADLDRREAELAAREKELAERAESVAALDAELMARAEAVAAREAEAACLTADVARNEDAVLRLKAQRRDLEAEVADLGRLAGELGPLVERLQLRRDEAAAAREQIEAKQSALDRRLIEIGRTELALQKRREELDQLEAELRAELEARERELERQRVALDEEHRTARQDLERQRAALDEEQRADRREQTRAAPPPLPARASVSVSDDTPQYQD